VVIDYETFAKIHDCRDRQGLTIAQTARALRAALNSAVRLAKAPPGAVMTSVRHILDQKGQQVWSVHPSDTVFDAIKMMADKDVGALVVLDGSKIVGILTERDYARNVFLKGRASPQTLVSEIMAPTWYASRPTNRSRKSWQS
jgi:signal-transduction protein with cAMP-binding, CBS, and nucleotidyltransferase domain